MTTAPLLPDDPFLQMQIPESYRSPQLHLADTDFPIANNQFFHQNNEMPSQFFNKTNGGSKGGLGGSSSNPTNKANGGFPSIDKINAFVGANPSANYADTKGYGGSSSTNRGGTGYGGSSSNRGGTGYGASSSNNNNNKGFAGPSFSNNGSKGVGDYPNNNHGNTSFRGSSTNYNNPAFGGAHTNYGNKGFGGSSSNNYGNGGGFGGSGNYGNGNGYGGGGPSSNYYQSNNAYRAPHPRRALYIVTFKCSRADVFYLMENTGLTLRLGDLVIVEADRGLDLGTVHHVDVSEEEARAYKKRYSEEQYGWLMLYTKHQAPSENQDMLQNAPRTMQSTMRETSIRPKAIRRLASKHDISILAIKEAKEARAKRWSQVKATGLDLRMEILDVEWQW